MDAEGANRRPLDFAGNVAGQYEVRHLFCSAPQWPVAGAPMVPSFNKKLQAGLPFLDDVIALDDTYLYSKHSVMV